MVRDRRILEDLEAGPGRLDERPEAENERPGLFGPDDLDLIGRFETGREQERGHAARDLLLTERAALARGEDDIHFNGGRAVLRGKVQRFDADDDAIPFGLAANDPGRGRDVPGAIGSPLEDEDAGEAGPGLGDLRPDRGPRGELRALEDADLEHVVVQAGGEWRPAPVGNAVPVVVVDVGDEDWRRLIGSVGPGPVRPRAVTGRGS